MKKYVTLIMIFIASLCGAQDMLTTDTFKKEISRGIVVVEFWASWNATNECQWLSKLNEFNNGNIEEQFDPNIMFQLEASKNDVQSTIDGIMLKQFE